MARNSSPNQRVIYNVSSNKKERKHKKNTYLAENETQNKVSIFENEVNA